MVTGYNFVCKTHTYTHTQTHKHICVCVCVCVCVYYSYYSDVRSVIYIKTSGINSIINSLIKISYYSTMCVTS